MSLMVVSYLFMDSHLSIVKQRNSQSETRSELATLIKKSFSFIQKETRCMYKI